MSTSGSNAQQPVTYTGRQMLERALRQCGIPTMKFTDEMVSTAFDVMQTMLDDFLNLGMQLWGRDRIILPLYLNRAEVPCPLGTSLVLSCNQRTLMRPTPLVMATDSGGNAALAFDGDLTTACTQVDPNGTITAFYEVGGVQITNIGVNFAATGSFAYMIEYSLDGTTWQAADAVSVIVTAGEWVWTDIEGTPSAMGWRLRSLTPDVPLAVNELYFGNNPQEIPMGVWNVDDYDTNPIKNSPGQPFLWFQDRRLDTPTLIVWPVPDATALFMSLTARRRRYLNQLTDMQQSFDLSRRWFEFATCSLARRLCKELPEADISRFSMLQSEELNHLQLAQGEERDPAPQRYNPGLEVYDF